MSRIVMRKLKVIHDLKIDFSNIITRNEMLEFKIFGIFKKTFPIKCYFSEKFTNLFFISQFYWKFSKFSNKEIYCTGISGIEVRSLINQREMLISIYSLLKSLISKFASILPRNTDTRTKLYTFNEDKRAISTQISTTLIRFPSENLKYCTSNLNVCWYSRGVPLPRPRNDLILIWSLLENVDCWYMTSTFISIPMEYHYVLKTVGENVIILSTDKWQNYIIS